MSPAGGQFATARRGGIDRQTVKSFAARGWGAQTISRVTGSCMEDVQRLLAPLNPTGDGSDWPFGECSPAIKRIVAAVAESHDVTLAEMAQLKSGGTSLSHGSLWNARNAAFAAVRETFPSLTYLDLEGIFRRDKSQIQSGIRRHALRIERERAS